MTWLLMFTASADLNALFSDKAGLHDSAVMPDTHSCYTGNTIVTAGILPRDARYCRKINDITACSYAWKACASDEISQLNIRKHQKRPYKCLTAKR